MVGAEEEGNDLEKYKDKANRDKNSPIQTSDAVNLLKVVDIVGPNSW